MAINQVNQEDLDRMKHIRLEMERVANRYRENTEAAIVAGAMMQVVVQIIANYPKEAREQLIEGAVAYLQGRDVDEEHRRTGSGLLLPRTH